MNTNIINFQEAKQKIIEDSSDANKLGDYAFDLAQTTLSSMFDDFDKWYLGKEKSFTILMTACAVMLTQSMESFLDCLGDMSNDKKYYIRNKLYQMFLAHIEEVKRMRNENSPTQ